MSIYLCFEKQQEVVEVFEIPVVMATNQRPKQKNNSIGQEILQSWTVFVHLNSNCI